jgi:hypothetical protein
MNTVARLLISVLGLAVLGACGGGGGGGSGVALAAPQGLLAAPRPGYFDLSWQAVPGADGYLVYVASVADVGPDNYWLVPDGRRQVVRGATSATFGTFPGSHVFYARVAALDGTASGGLSESVPVLLPPDAPAFVLPQAGIGEVELRIGAVSGAGEYELFLAADETVTSENYASLAEGRVETLTSFVHRVTGLVNGRTYFFVVRARNASGPSLDSYRVSATPSARGSLGAPFCADVGDGPVALATADFDGDGHLDLATANETSGTVTVLRGDGAGAFGLRVDHAVGGFPTALLARDVGGDARVDLVTANGAAGTVSVLSGDGLGGFAPFADYPAGASPAGIGAGDFDGDGRLDLVVADVDADALQWLRGTNPGFAAPVATPVAAGPTSLAVADFDGDGFLDVALAASLDGVVTVLYGDGSGAFPRRTDLPIGPGARSVSVVDFDRDGLPDVAALSVGNEYLGILVSRGPLGFLPPFFTSTDGGANSFAVADMDGDARLDLILADGGTANLSVLLGRSGTFWHLTDVPTSPIPTSMTLVDINCDGILDAIVTNSQTGSVEAMLGQS